MGDGARHFSRSQILKIIKIVVLMELNQKPLQFQIVLGAPATPTLPFFVLRVVHNSINTKNTKKVWMKKDLDCKP
jgi:hypothetical protein